MVSIKDVAKHAGVAISTVSKVLNDYPNVSEEMKEKVKRAVEELNYIPNSVAASLSSKHADRVALLINLNVKTTAIDEIAMQYILGALDKAMELKLDVITLFFFMFQGKSVEEVIRYLKSQNITGLIIYGLSKEDDMLHKLIASEEFKVVIGDAPIVNVSTSSVWIDHKTAQYEVAKKTVLENTGKRVLYIAGKKNGYVTEERLDGMEKLVKELNLSMTVKWGDFSELKARNITLKNGEDADIIVCASDLMAIGAMNALKAMRIDRPVCGFDGIILMGYVSRQMYTVRQNFSGVSARAMEELYLLMNGGEGRNIRMEYSLTRLQYEDIIC